MTLPRSGLAVSPPYHPIHVAASEPGDRPWSFGAELRWSQTKAKPRIHGGWGVCYVQWNICNHQNLDHKESGSALLEAAIGPVDDLSPSQAPAICRQVVLKSNRQVGHSVL